jgi:glutaminyl-peptide cyclotransferase
MRVLVTFTALTACTASPAPPAAAAADPPVYGYQVENVYRHDRGAFTQGLIYRDGRLYESTGLEGHSTVRHVRLEDGEVLRSVSLPPDIFGEGLALWNSELISISWRNGIAYRWDRETLRRLGEFRYSGEGWGLTSDGRRLIMSDGTPVLRFLDPATFRELGRVTVTAGGRPLGNLNELEWVRGEVFANVWMTDYIARIDPATGEVKGWIDLRQLSATVERRSQDDVLNGIAYDEAGDRLFVTGKNWPSLFQIRIEPPPGQP